MLNHNFWTGSVTADHLIPSPASSMFKPIN